MRTLKYHNQDNQAGMLKAEKLLYRLENGWYAFQTNLENALKNSNLALPNEFVFINNSSGATEWIIYFQELGYNVSVEKAQFANRYSFDDEKFRTIIVMVVSK